MLDGLLSLLGIGGGGQQGMLPPFAGQPQAQQQPQMPQQGPGMGDRFMAGAQGFLNSSSPMGAIGNLLGGLSSGSRTDPAGVQASAVQGMLGQLQRGGQIDATTARFLAANPKAWEELSKAMINVPMTVAPDGSIIQNRPFGQLGIPGGVPISDPAKRINPDGSQSDSYNIRPSLTNPQGGSVVPGQPAPQPQPAPQGMPAPQGQQALNPNMPNGGRPVISQQSPQAIQEQEGIGKDLAAQYADITKKASAATTRLGTLNRMSQLSPDAFQGAGAPALQFVRSLLTTAGVPAGSVKPGEEFIALSNKMVLDANNGTLGPGVSNSDVIFISKINPDISHTREGRMELIQTSRELAKRDQEVARQAATYRKEHGSLDGFQVYISEWANRPENEMFKNRSPATAAPSAGAPDNRPGAPGIRIIGVR